MEAGQGLMSAVSSYAKGDMGGVFKSAMGLVKTATGKTQKAEKIAKATRTSPADVVRTPLVVMINRVAYFLIDFVQRLQGHSN